MGEQLLRGTIAGARCEECPFSRDGQPTNPVVSEFPDDPAWLVIGEGPGFNETRQQRPFVGASGQVVNQLLKKIGRDRDHLYIGNATLCMPPQGSPVEEREKAAECCKPRLLTELAWFPGKPVLTLGAVAARAVIPKETLDAIDPPDVPKSKKRAQKDKQKNERKIERKKKAAIEKLAVSRFRKAEKRWRADITRNLKRKSGYKPSDNYFEQPDQARARAGIWKKALEEAPREYEQAVRERAIAAKSKTKKPKKKKPIKITDIVSTLFDVDCGDGSVRPVIPAIHPAALLHGGGATIGGSHTPDMAYVNLLYDAAKVDALAKGKDIRLKFEYAFEVDDAERATRLFIDACNSAIDLGSYSLDLETYVDDQDRHHALMQYEARIRVIGLCTDERAVSVLWDLIPEWARLKLQVVLGTVHGQFHNGLYDRTVLRNKHHGFIIPIFGRPGSPGFSDSLLAHHAAFPGNSHKLQTVTAQLAGVGPWKSEFRNQEETPAQLAIYNAKDTGSTHVIVPPLEIWVKRTATEKVYARDRRMCDIASRMHLRGQPVSRDVNSQLVSTFTRLAKDARAKVEAQATDPKVLDRVRHKLAIMLAAKKRKKDEAGISPLREMALESGKGWTKTDEYEALYNARKRDLDDESWYWKINNSKHIAAFLQALDVPLTQVTEGGAISTKREILESLVDVPIVRDLLEYRENEKMKDFTVPIFDRVVGGETVSYGFSDSFDRIHPIWSIHKISGRWAGSEPMGTSNPPREKTKKVPFGMVLPTDAIITGFICECGKYDRDSHKDHVYKPKFIEYAYRPTTKRQIVAPNGRVIVGFDFCLAPETRVLTAGLRWVRIDSLKPGDELVGFGEDVQVGQAHKFERSVVEVVQKFQRPCARITTDRGTIVASLDHSFVRRRARKARHWAKTSELRVGDKLIFFTDPWPNQKGWEEGYMAGFLDGEGWISGSNTNHRIGGGAGFGQNNGPTLEHALNVLKRRGYTYSLNESKTGCVRVLPTGEWQSVRMVGEFQPPRLLSKSHLLWEGRRTWSTNSRPATILKIEFIGEQEVVAIRTSTKTFIAEGFFSHNCQVEARILALISGDPFMCDVFGRDGDLHTECAIEVFAGFMDKTPSERKMMRTVCKTLEYATWYGAADEKVWKGLLKEGHNLKLVDVVGSLNRLRKKMGGIITWQRATIHRASQPPYELRDFVSGRRRVWPMGQVEASEALNIVPQATGAALMNEGMELFDDWLIDQGFIDAFCISQIHDAAYFECDQDDADKLAEGIKLCFTSERTNAENGRTVKFPVEVGIGQSMNDV